MTDHLANAGNPIPTLELAELLEQNALMPLDDVAAAELRRLHAELVEADALRKKMSDILRRTATALKGEPDELTLHSWHDLPEVAMTLRYEVDAIAAKAAKANWHLHAKGGPVSAYNAEVQRRAGIIGTSAGTTGSTTRSQE